MRFRRAGQRYSTTPVPVTPYQQAAQVWDERIGSARAQARNWRWMAFGCLGLSLLMVVGLLWQLGRSTVTPYVVEVDRLGEVRAVGPALEAYRRSEEHTSELQSLMRISYAVFCLKKKIHASKQINAEVKQYKLSIRTVDIMIR